MKKALLSGAVIALLSLTAPSWAQESTPSATSEAVITSININEADEQQLAMLSGIGPAKAKAIVTYREEHGPFNSIDELSKVSGIGNATVEKNRHLLTE